MLISFSIPKVESSVATKLGMDSWNVIIILGLKEVAS